MILPTNGARRCRCGAPHCRRSRRTIQTRRGPALPPAATQRRNPFRHSRLQLRLRLKWPALAPYVSPRTFLDRPSRTGEPPAAVAAQNAEAARPSESSEFVAEETERRACRSTQNAEGNDPDKIFHYRKHAVNQIEETTQHDCSCDTPWTDRCHLSNESMSRTAERLAHQPPRGQNPCAVARRSRQPLRTGIGPVRSPGKTRPSFLPSERTWVTKTLSTPATDGSRHGQRWTPNRVVPTVWSLRRGTPAFQTLRRG